MLNLGNESGYFALFFSSKFIIKRRPRKFQRSFYRPTVFVRRVHCPDASHINHPFSSDEQNLEGRVMKQRATLRFLREEE